MAIVIGVVAGLMLVGLATGSFAGAVLGAALGAFLGYVIGHRPKPAQTAAATQPDAPLPTVASESLADRVSTLERRVMELERALRIAAAPPAVTETAPILPAPESKNLNWRYRPHRRSSRSRRRSRSHRQARPMNADGTLAITDQVVGGVATDVGERDFHLHRRRRRIRSGRGSSAATRWRASASLLLFIGVAFLLKYAVEHVTVPISSCASPVSRSAASRCS